LALACEPRLLIADEPTTGLDVTTQKTIMDLIYKLAKDNGLAVMLITHDLGVAQQYCNKVVVMQTGKVIERCEDKSIFTDPKHAYSQKLLAATPDARSNVVDLTPEPPEALLTPAPSITETPLLTVNNLVKEYAAVRKWPWQKTTGGFKAVNGVSFELFQGECLGLVGESGCGKSTLSRVITRLESPTSGDIIFGEKNITELSDKQFRQSRFRRDIQMVFQDPTGSLNPRHTVSQLIAEPLSRLDISYTATELSSKVSSLAKKVGLPEHLIHRLPHQLSGGQKARVGIARAIALNPKLLILDEPTSALDVSVQAVVLQLLEQLRRELGMSYLFVSHDLNVVKMLSQRVLVMQAGELVEFGLTEEVMNAPKHAFTKTLLASIPNLDVAI
jgi:peptide/nickel transport system ATP-binding protein